MAAVQRRYLPDAVLAWGERYDSPLWQGRRDGLAYVCHDYLCEAPVDTVDGPRRRCWPDRRPPTPPLGRTSGAVNVI